MNWLALFSPARRGVIEEAPRHARWRRVRPKPNQRPVRARRAEADTIVETSTGDFRARGGRDYIVTHDMNDRRVVRGDIFDRTYESLGGGLYRKRPDLLLRYFVLDRPASVRTLEGLVKAERGDWVMEGVMGELWPIRPEKARESYDPAD